MVEQEVVRRIRVLAEAGWGHKRIAREVGVARNTVRRYLRAGSAADKQVWPKARRLVGQEQQRAVELWNGAAEGNAVVVKALLAQEGMEASVRTVQRAVEERRRQVHAAQVATVRFETKPGQQMQVDFGGYLLGVEAPGWGSVLVSPGGQFCCRSTAAHGSRSSGLWIATKAVAGASGRALADSAGTGDRLPVAGAVPSIQAVPASTGASVSLRLSPRSR